MVAMTRRRRRRPDTWVDALVEGDRIPADRIDDPDEIDALRAAIALRAGRPGADLPSEEFLTGLRQQLEDSETPAGGGQPVGLPSRRLSRRNLLTGAGAAAAGVAAGVTGAVVDREVLHPGTPAHHDQETLALDDGRWTAVAHQDELAGGQVKHFTAPGIVGFVSQQGDELVAVSGACTHLGCLLQANEPQGRLDCPCHRTAFGYGGAVLFSQLPDQPAPLPKLPVRRRDGAVEVLVPRQT
jgi:Rieske Fe-S protein